MKDPALLTVEQFSYAFPEQDGFVLDRIHLVIEPGEVHCITGPTGCGKTTLLMAIRGLLPEGRREGTIAVNIGKEVQSDAAVAGIVMQNPLMQLLGDNLGAEVAFGLENHCVAPPKMPPMVAEALDWVGLHRPFDTPVRDLSLGQQYRACMAGVLVMGTRIVLLDEPAAQLDPIGVEQLLIVIRKLKAKGTSFIICDHQPEALMPVIDHHRIMTSQGQLRDASTISQRPFRPAPHQGAITLDQKGQNDRSYDFYTTAGESFQQKHDREVIRAGDLVLVPEADPNRQHPYSFSVARGEHVVIIGPNGSGKTTLVRCLLGLQPVLSGTLRVFGASPRINDLRGRVGVLFQNPAKQLFHTTVFEEVAFAAKRRWSNSTEVNHRIDNLLARLGIASLRNRSPHNLSYGQKQLVLLAAAAADEPEVLILDDPLAGLDADKADSVMGLLMYLSQVHKTTIVRTSHNVHARGDSAVRIIRLAVEIEKTLHLPAFLDLKKATGVQSALLRLPPGIALVTSIFLAMTAFAARSIPLLLLLLTLINLSVLLLGSKSAYLVLCRSLRIFFWQSVLIGLLYAFRFGWASVYSSGLIVAWQLFLAFWPGIILMSTISSDQIARTLGRLMPYSAAFVVSTCLRFVPVLIHEMRTIRNGQLFRGARLLKNDLADPRFWYDGLHCLMVPTLVRTLSLSRDIALAATARDFGRYKKKTYWPGDQKT